METDPGLYDALWGLYKAVWLMGQARNHLESIEHPALGDVERILDRLNEEYSKLNKEMPKG